MQDSKLWGPHPLVNFLDLWKSTLTLKHLLDAFGQSSGAHRSCVLGSQVQHGMLSGCNVKRGANPSGGKKKIYIYIKKHSLRNFCTLWGDIGLARNMCKFQPHKPGPTQTPCAPPVRELWVACSATQELPTRPSYAPKTLEQKRKSVGTKKAVLEVLGQKSLRWTRKSHIGTLLPRDVSLHDCRHIEIDA